LTYPKNSTENGTRIKKNEKRMKKEYKKNKKEGGQAPFSFRF